MRDLELHFSGGNVVGSGLDVVGPFTFHGTYQSDGTVNLVKRYRRHTVNYAGQYDGEGTVYGEWSIGTYLRGKFALTPNRSAKPKVTSILEIEPDESAS